MGSNLQSGDGDDEAEAQLQALMVPRGQLLSGREGVGMRLGVWAVRTQAGTCLLHDFRSLLGGALSNFISLSIL